MQFILTFSVPKCYAMHRKIPKSIRIFRCACAVGTFYGIIWTKKNRTHTF